MKLRVQRLVTGFKKLGQYFPTILLKSTTMVKDLTEVEARFLVPSSIEDRIADLGGKLSRELTFTDRYYDTQDWKLTLQDFWLRKRDTRWELKYPPGSRSGGNSPCTQYAENEDEKEICGLVKSILGTNKEGTVDSLVEEGKCAVYAEYQTHRRSYKFNSHPNITVDLDISGFGFNLGEVEVMTSGSMSEAMDMVHNFADKLGVELSGDIPSKMDLYLAKFHPQHYQVLVQMGISSKYCHKFLPSVDFKE